MVKRTVNDISELLEPIIEILRSNPGKFFSIKQISQKIGISEIIAREAIGGLSSWGYRFEIDQGNSYKFKSAPDALFPFEIKFGLKTTYIGQEIESHFSVNSTNETAFRWAENGAPEGAMVIAEKQIGGKGRLGRSWHSPPKTGLWFSLILRPEIHPAQAPGLSIMSALTLSEVLQQKYKLKSRIKWPNDCLIDNYKVAGILTELSAEPNKINFVIMGMGVNVNIASRDFPTELRSTATSIQAETGEKIDRIRFLRNLLVQFEKNYEIFRIRGLKPFHAKIRRHSLMLGKIIKLKLGKKIVQATAFDIDPDGALLAKHRKEILRVTAGEVTILEHD